ncbi:MAG: hypothetical protein ACI8TL_001473 [Natronomonas sp.]|jgi:uncharacterized protein (TIGR00369 family)
MTEDETDERLETLRARANGHGFHESIGYTLEAVGDGWARASVPHSPEFVNPPTEAAMHGGITASVVDAVIGHAIMGTLYDESGRRCGPTINLDISYVSTADEPLVARGEVLRIGKHNALGEGRIEGADTGKLVATGQGVWRVFGDE